MKLLDKIMDQVLEKTRDSRLFPIFEAGDTILRHPISRLSGAPYLRQGMDAKRFMIAVVLALAPAAMGAIYFFGLRALMVIAVSYIAGGIVEVIFSIVRRHEISEGFLVTGLLLPLTLPVDIPLWMVALGSAFGVLFGKEVFGGVGRNIFNPALVGRAFLYLSFPKAMSSGWVISDGSILDSTYLRGLVQGGAAASADIITGATPLITSKLAVTSGGSATEALESGYSVYQLLTGWHGGSMGETSIVLILLGAIFLFGSRVANWRAPAGATLSVVVLSYLLNLMDPAHFAPAHYSLLAGSFLFGAIFMLTDPVSAPGTNLGRWIYGVAMGALVVIIRGMSGYPAGVMFSILIMNIFAPLLDQLAISRLKRRLEMRRRARHVEG